jgi:hypothetical protein
MHWGGGRGSSFRNHPMGLKVIVRAFGLRGCRYTGESRALLQHLATAVAIDLVRIGAWLIERPSEGTRTTPIARLMITPQPA